MDFVVKDLTKNNKKRPKYIPKHLPFKFRMLIIAPSGTGKTNLVCNLICRKKFGYKKYFKNNIYLFSPTYFLDDTWDSCKKLEPKHVYDDYDEEPLQEIIQKQQQYVNDGEKPPPTLIVFDDLAHALQRHKTLLLRKTLEHRYNNMSSIIKGVSQSYTNECYRCYSVQG